MQRSHGERGRLVTLVHDAPGEAVVRVDVVHDHRLAQRESHARHALAEGHRVHLARRQRRARGRCDAQLVRFLVEQHQRRLARAEHIGRRLGAQRCKGLRVGLGRLLFRLLQPRGQGQHLRLEPPQALAQPLPARFHVEARQRAAHRQHQLLVVQGLRQVVAGVEPQRLEHELLIGVGREHDHAQRRPLAVQPAQHVDAAHVGERHVEHHDADLRIARGGQARRAVLQRLALDAGFGERLPNRLPEEAFVIDHEDARSGLGHGSGS